MVIRVQQVLPEGFPGFYRQQRWSPINSGSEGLRKKECLSYKGQLVPIDVGDWSDLFWYTWDTKSSFSELSGAAFVPVFCHNKMGEQNARQKARPAVLFAALT